MAKCYYLVSSDQETLDHPNLTRVLAQSRDLWFILCAERGLLSSEQGLRRDPVAEEPLSSEPWSARVLADLLQQTRSGDTLVFLSGWRFESLLSGLVGAGRRVETPLLSLDPQEQAAWLNHRFPEADSRVSQELPAHFEQDQDGPAATGPLSGNPSDQSYLLSVILEQMAEGVIVADHDGQFKFFNQQAEALLGLRPAVSPEQWSEYFQTQYMDETGALRPVQPDRVPMRRALAGEKVDNEEYYLGRGRGREGAWISVNSRPLRGVAGESMGAVSVCRDITDLKAAEQEARRAHRDFHQVIEASRDGVGIHREGRWVYLNPALLAALGYQEMADLCSTPLLDLLPEENRAEARDWVEAPVEGRLPAVAEFDFMRRDGTLVSMEVCPALLTEFEGDEAVLVVFRDITERKKLESQLMISDRMASLGTVASGVGHEINNPLSVVMMNLELALKEVQSTPVDSEGIGEVLQEALSAAQRVSRIVRDLKIFSLGETSNLTPVDVHAVLDSAAGVLLNELRFRAVLIKRYASDLPPVLAAEPKLAQVALNLLLNAVQSIPEGDVESNTVVLTTEREGDCVRFSVSDTGSGISPEVARQMFTPFFSTKPVGTGSGLGLSLCYRIVTSLGGTISFQSQPGTGSTFTVSLPALLATEAAEPVQATSESAASGPGRVLVVDDEPGVCLVLKRTLGRDHAVDVCEDGLAALRAIQSGARYDVILCDLMMPQMTGLQLYENLAEQAPDQAARMVFLTGGAFTDSTRLFLEKTTRPVLFKPCPTAKLRAVVGSTMAEARNPKRAAS
jgi:PAS domain S-box-containing protein